MDIYILNNLITFEIISKIKFPNKNKSITNNILKILFNY